MFSFSKHRDGFGSIKIRARHPAGKGQSQRDEEQLNHDGNTPAPIGNSTLDLFKSTEVCFMHYSFPFRFLVPDNATDGDCCWIYPVTFGGGLVAGDKLTARYDIGDECAAIISSQESTKIYHCLHDEHTFLTSTFQAGNSCLLCVLPDPIVVYRDAHFSQKQVVNLTPSSNLVFLDWMLSGRVALDESWAFKRYCNSIEIYIEDELVLRECTDLEDTPSMRVAESMGDYQVLGTCIILGSFVRSHSASLLSQYGRKRDLGEKTKPGLLVSVSPLCYQVKGQEVNGCYLRFMAVDVKSARSVIQDITQPLLPVLGADPFEKKL